MSRKYKVKRYGSIYGPSRKKSVIKNTLTVLAVALLFFGAWLVYEPFMNFIKELQSPAPLPPISSGVGEEPGASSPQDEDTSPASKPVLGSAGGMVYLPASIIQNRTLLLQSLEELDKSASEIRGIVFDIKAEDGTVLYRSNLQEVASTKAQAASAFDLHDISSAISDAGFVPVGRIFVFKDSIAPRAMHEAAVKYVGTEFNWVDNSIENGGKLWLNPYSEQAGDYNLKIIGEAMDLGLRSVMLEGVQFPTGFSLEKAHYGADAASKSRAQALLDFANAAEQLVSDKSSSSHCWLTLPAPALAVKDASPLSPFGGDIALLASYPQLMLDFSQTTAMASGIGGQLGLTDPAAPYSEMVASMVRLVGDAGGKVTPIVQATSAAGSPEPDSSDIKNQLKILKENNMSEGYVLWSITGGYRHLLSK